jgi:hypothetical protein
MPRRLQKGSPLEPCEAWVLLTCLLACAGAQMSGTPQILHDGYDRRPGSFCALNPEGCPPEQEPLERPSPEDEDAALGKSECLDACEAGGEVLANFCRRLKSPRRQALCWAATHGSKTACIGMCHAIYR